MEKARQNPDHRGDEEYNYFMAVCFQASQLTILDYNRVVKDLSPRIVSQQFDNDCTIRLAIRRSMAEELRSRLGVGGKASPGPSEGGEGLAG